MRQFDKASKTDEGLTIVGIGFRQTSIEIAMEYRRVTTGKSDLPGLPIVGIGRQYRISKGVEPRIPRRITIEIAPRREGRFGRTGD